MPTTQLTKTGRRVVVYSAAEAQGQGRVVLDAPDRPTLRREGLQAADEGRAVVAGRALVFDTDFPRYDFTMRVASGSLDRYLEQNGGTMGRIDALYNHATDFVPYASTQDGSLRLRVDKEALHYDFDLDLSLERHRELAAAVRNRRIDRSSASFYVMKEEWDDEQELRTLTELDFTGGEISVVRVPANPVADASLLADVSEDRLRLAEAELRFVLGG